MSKPSITKWPPAASAKSTCSFAAAGADGRQAAACTSTSSRTSPASTARRRRSCPSRCSATTAPACTRTSRCGRTASRCSPAAATRAFRDMATATPIGGSLKHAPALLRLQQPHDQQLQAARARVRSAGQSRLFAAQSLGVDPHPDVQPQPQGEADRVPLPRPELQSVPRVRRDADGGDRRHPEQDPARANRSTRTSTTCRPKN